MLKTVIPPIVIKRMSRNLQYRLTYAQVLETFTQPDPGPEVVGLLNSLVQAQQAAARLVSGYLKGLDVDTQDLPLKHGLLKHASERQKVDARLRFIHSGLSKAASWYKVQLLDRDMTADPELKRLLLELGELDAASLWRMEAIMAARGLLPSAEREERPEPPPLQQDRAPGWRSRQAADLPRPSRQAGRSRKKSLSRPDQGS